MVRHIVVSIVVLRVLAMPLEAGAQPTGKVPRIGYLSVSSPSAEALRRQAFGERLRDLGWIEGQNVLIEERWADGQYDKLPGLAGELVRLRTDVIVIAGDSPVIRAAKEATSTIPIVMTIGVDPVEQRFIASVGRPGGNITGMAWDTDPAIGGKYLELLKDMVPGLRRVGVLIDRANRVELYPEATEQAAIKLGLKVHIADAGTLSEIEGAFASFTKQSAQAVLVYGSSLFNVNRRRIIALAAQGKLASISPTREYVEAGGLMSYGVNIVELYRGAAGYVDKILRGAKPADLPVAQPTKYELVINHRTATALGLTIPPSVLARADQIIE